MFYDASVIVLFEQLSKSLVLTRRNAALNHHPGEVCFPGGRWQEEDQNLLQTGLRELKEELGIDSSRITILKSMNMERTLTGYNIQPWLGLISSVNPFNADNNEVAEVLTVPFEQVIIKNNYQPIEVMRQGIKIVSLQFIWGNQNIWGATARIMQQFCRQQEDYIRLIESGFSSGA